MNLSLNISKKRLDSARAWYERQNFERWVIGLSVFFALAATAYSFKHGYIIAYGDAESHLDIAKRVVDSLTPGFAQLGGIWLPLPHLLLIPFVYFNPLWRTGLAGSIVSGACYVVSAWYLYKTIFLLTKSGIGSFVGALVFMLNPNILYLQTTPMTEMTLIVFFILSTYYFIVFLYDQKNLAALLASAFFGFCSTLSRYDGWSLVLTEAGILFLLYLPWKKIPRNFRQIKEYWDNSKFKEMEGKIVLFSTAAFFGIALWFGWDWLILGDPLYFTDSVYSAKSQQQAWLIRGELPANHHILVAFLYYAVDTMSNVGVIMFLVSIAAMIYLLSQKEVKKKWYVVLLLLVPFIFNVATLWLGQSVIFLPSITPVSFEWRLFNVRYGVMMAPAVAVFIGYLFYRIKASGRLLIISLMIFQILLYLVGYSQVISLEDGVTGLSSAVARPPDAQNFLNAHYDGGLVLADDFARSISIIRSPVPMKDMIYVGNKPYWADSLVAPEKYATWIVMQKNDAVWTALYDDPAEQGRLYKYFVKEYTSPDTLIFKRNPDVPEQGS